jgi:hypothetical protein
MFLLQYFVVWSLCYGTWQQLLHVCMSSDWMDFSVVISYCHCCLWLYENYISIQYILKYELKSIEFNSWTVKIIKYSIRDSVQKYYLNLLATQQSPLTDTFTPRLEMYLPLVSINVSNGRPCFWSREKTC